MSNIHRSLIKVSNLSNIRSFEMVPTKFRKRLRKKYDLSISQVSISANFRKAGTRWMNKTKAREKVPVASIHLKHDFNLARYLDIWIQNEVLPIQDHLWLQLAASPWHDDSLCEALKLNFEFYTCLFSFRSLGISKFYGVMIPFVRL